MCTAGPGNIYVYVPGTLYTRSTRRIYDTNVLTSHEYTRYLSVTSYLVPGPGMFFSPRQQLVARTYRTAFVCARSSFVVVVLLLYVAHSSKVAV